MSQENRKPYHETIILALKETVQKLVAIHSNPKPSAFQSLLAQEALDMEIKLLKSTKVPEKHIPEMAEAIRQILANCPPQIADKLSLKKMAQGLLPPPPEIPAETAHAEANAAP